jgi:hypothetical protein
MCKAVRSELRILDVAHLDAVLGKRECELLAAYVILRRGPPGEKRDGQRDTK